MKERGYTVLYEPLAEGGYQVIVPALPGIVTFGRTLEEAREMARDAIACHVRGLLKDGEDIPEDPFTAEDPIRRAESPALTSCRPAWPTSGPREAVRALEGAGYLFMM